MSRKQTRQVIAEIDAAIERERLAMKGEGNEGPYELRAGRINALEWVSCRLQETLKVDAIIG